ncbi:MAG TPA: aldehyde dehydrogenase family protein [Acidobacteriota bacterium]|nr:aldehyde dehydrogenase family protein [Acidobacteriota bacterium]
MTSEYRVLINGELCEASTKETMEVINPANGTLVGRVPKCGPLEINRAAEAAWKAAPAWAEKSPTEKAAIFFRMAELLRAHREEWARLETMQYGGPIFKTYNFDMRFDAEHFEFMAGVARAVTGMTLPVGPQAMSMTIRQPLGVVGLITPWNFPLVTAISKITPALMMGNTAVVKPPSCAPLTVLKFGELVNEAGFPPGVLNIVTGPGATTGEALVNHPYVSKINFTGDSETGKRILALASAAVKPVACELGGKNAFIVLPDADMKATIEGAVWGGFFNSGQNCGASSRYLIHESVYDEFAEKFVAAAKKLRVGDPLNPETMIGPVAYKGHRDNIERFIERTKKSGAKLLLGGERPDTPETRNGYFVAPTIFGDCDPKSEIMQEEVFGPVVALARFKTPEEAVAIANDSRFGLCSSIWTKDIRQGLVMTRQLKVGTVWLNQHLSIVFECPWGGCKESGHSKENSIMVLDEYCMIKNVWIDLVGRPATPWEGKLD